MFPNQQKGHLNKIVCSWIGCMLKKWYPFYYIYVHFFKMVLCWTKAIVKTSGTYRIMALTLHLFPKSLLGQSLYSCEHKMFSLKFIQKWPDPTLAPDPLHVSLSETDIIWSSLQIKSVLNSFSISPGPAVFTVMQLSRFCCSLPWLWLCRPFLPASIPHSVTIIWCLETFLLLANSKLLWWPNNTNTLTALPSWQPQKLAAA